MKTRYADCAANDGCQTTAGPETEQCGRGLWQADAVQQSRPPGPPSYTPHPPPTGDRGGGATPNAPAPSLLRGGGGARGIPPSTSAGADPHTTALARDCPPPSPRHTGQRTHNTSPMPPGKGPKSPAYTAAPEAGSTTVSPNIMARTPALSTARPTAEQRGASREGGQAQEAGGRGGNGIMWPGTADVQGPGSLSTGTAAGEARALDCSRRLCLLLLFVLRLNTRSRGPHVPAAAVRVWLLHPHTPMSRVTGEGHRGTAGVGE